MDLQMLTKFFFLSLLVGSSISVSFAMQRSVVSKDPVVKPRRLVGGLKEFDNLGGGLCSLYALGFPSPGEALHSLNQYQKTKKHDLEKNQELLCKFKGLNDAIRALEANPRDMKNWLSPSQIQVLAFFALGRKAIFLEARFSVEAWRVGYPIDHIQYELGQIAVGQHREKPLSAIVPGFEDIKDIFVGYRTNHYTALVDPNDQAQIRIAKAIEDMKTKQLQLDEEMARKLQAELAKPAPSLPAAAPISQPPPFIFSAADREMYTRIETLYQSIEEDLRLDPKNKDVQKDLQEVRDLKERFLEMLKQKH